MSNHPNILSVFLDGSGSVSNFVSQSLVSALLIPVIKIASWITVNALDGRPLSERPVTHLTEPLRLDFSLKHSQYLQLYVLSSIHIPVLLGLPWF